MASNPEWVKAMGLEDAIANSLVEVIKARPENPIKALGEKLVKLGSMPTCLVMNSTGTQGSAIVRGLSAANHFQILALTRDPTGERANKINKLPNVRMVKVNANEPEELDQTFASLKPDAVFSMQPNDLSPGAAEAEIKQGLHVVDLCKKYKVGHVCVSGVAQYLPSNLSDIVTKLQIKEHLIQSGVPYTIVGAGWFIENWFHTGGTALTVAGPKHIGYMNWDMANGRKQQVTYVEDMGKIVAQVLQEGSKWHGEQIDVINDELTTAEIVQVFSEHNGVEMEPHELYPMAHLKRLLKKVGDDPAVKDFLTLGTFMSETNWSVDVAALKAKFPYLKTLKEALAHANYAPQPEHDVSKMMHELVEMYEFKEGSDEYKYIMESDEQLNWDISTRSLVEP